MLLLFLCFLLVLLVMLQSHSGLEGLVILRHVHSIGRSIFYLGPIGGHVHVNVFFVVIYSK
eukprot:15342298-Ditylum_brightwellii.AAC.1